MLTQRRGPKRSCRKQSPTTSLGPQGDPCGDGILDIEDNQAELWVLSRGTEGESMGSSQY